MTHRQKPRPFRDYQCDSYFVEPHDAGIQTKAGERHRAVSRIQQEIAEELSRQTADEYQEDSMQHMIRMESQTLPDVSLIDIQPEIQWCMRPDLLDFLVEAHAAFQLLPETLFLAVNLLDRYCSCRVVRKCHYQLIGCIALLIAAKYGDKKDRVPTVRELKSMCCELYDDEMFTQMEWHVLQILDWVIGHTTVDAFLQIALSEAPYDAEVEHMTLYIAEIALFHKEFVSTRPSVLARSALALARCVLSRPQACNTDWSGAHDPPNSQRSVQLSPPAISGPFPQVCLEESVSRIYHSRVVLTTADCVSTSCLASTTIDLQCLRSANCQQKSMQPGSQHKTQFNVSHNSYS
ncbi:unnamed protein product [Alternaria alternata]